MRERSALPPPSQQSEASASMCPFGPDCPSYLALQTTTRQYHLALQANDVLRQTHDEAIERYTEITTRLTAETTALAHAHDSNEHLLKESQEALARSLAQQSELARRLRECERERDHLQRDVGVLTNASAALSERVELMADALDKLSSHHEAALLRIRFLEERWETHVREARHQSTHVPEASVTSTCRPMIDMVTQLEQLRGKPPSFTAVRSPQGDASPCRELPVTTAILRGDKERADLSARVASTVDELSKHARDLADLCVDKPELQRMLRQLRDVQHRNAELKANLNAAENTLKAETLVAEAKARAQEVYWERKAQEAQAHANEWKRLAESATTQPAALVSSSPQKD